MTATPEPSDVEAAELAQEILSRPDYARFDAPADWLVELLERITSFMLWLAELRRDAPLLHAVLLAAIILIGAGLMAHIVWSVHRALRAPLPNPVARPREAPPDFWAEVAALAGAGRYLDASHRLLIGSLAALARERVIDLAPHDTNRVVHRALARAQLTEPLRQTLQELIALTDRAWFGRRAEDRALYLRWRGAFAELTGRSGGE